MTNLETRKIEELKAGFEGEILLPSDGAYESARKIWNAMIDNAPPSSLAAPPRRTSSVG